MLISILLGLSAKPIGSRPYVLNIDVAFLVQVAEQPSEGIVDFADVLRLLRLAVGFIRYLDVEIEAALSLLGERFSRNDPIIGIDVLDRNGGDLRLLAQDSSGD
jgi:hypothetical protein